MSIINNVVKRIEKLRDLLEIINDQIEIDILKAEVYSLRKFCHIQILILKLQKPDTIKNAGQLKYLTKQINELLLDFDIIYNEYYRIFNH